MISLQSHNQVLYHLMQLTSAFGSRTTPSVVKAKKPNETVCKKTEELCESSLMEAARNCQGLRVVKLNISNIATPKVKKNDVCVMLDNVSVNISQKLSNRNSKWTESYAVSTSVTDGKQTFPDTRDADVIVLPALRLSSQQQKRLLHSLCGKVNVQSHVETRGFKSKRLLKEEMEKDNSLASLIKKQLRKFFNEKEKSKLSSFLNGQQGAEKLKTIFNNADLTQEERTRVKLAFVEGYEAGVERKTPQKSLLKIMYNLTIIAIVFSLICYTIINAGSMSGVFKLPIISQPEVDAEKISVTFDDVKGIDEAKLELKEVVEFLRNPAKFSSLGGKLPKGILLVGPPGTGKTLLARAVAGEAEVPFFYATGPEFDEILVGQGARRVRDLFKTAKERAPCVLFIDEIDSIGSKRTNSSIHPYANQTINQLLSEMDGFHHNDGVIVLGATNRRDDLDKALLRPGRFDVQIFIHIPDYDGRVDLFKLYLSKIMTKDMDLDELARVTMSFTGADIENMVNQAALRAAVEGAEYVTMEHMEYARDKVTLGPTKTKKTIEQRTLLVTAYHESGHALVAAYTNHSMDLHKVTIISRGMSLGHTSYLGEKDPYLTTKAQFLARLDCLMGGRAAEELIFGKEFITTGAKSDLQYATEIAESMVTKFGMSEKAGLRVRERRKELKEYGTDSSELVDAEVKRLLQESYERAKAILTTHAKEHKNLAEALLKYETLEAKEVMEIAQGRKIRDERLSDDSRIQTEDNRKPETIPI